MRASLPVPPGDIYNVTVTACTERSRNASTPSIIRLGAPFFFSLLRFHPQRFHAGVSLLCISEPAPPRSLYAVNATPSSVTLLWVEEGVVDYYQVLCKANRSRKELKVTPAAHQAPCPGAPQRPRWPAAASTLSCSPVASFRLESHRC